MNEEMLFNELVQAIEANDIKTLQRQLRIATLNFPLDRKITLPADKSPLLSLTDNSGNTLLLIAANHQNPSIAGYSKYGL